MNIIAYGSLLNQSSLEKTLGRPAQLKRLEVSGYRRIFNAPFGKYSFLNLQRNPESIIDAAYFELDPNELRNFAKRENGSKMIEVNKGFWAFVWPTALCLMLPVLQSYIEVCQSGANTLGIDLWQDTMQPLQVINDSADPLYPSRA